MPKLYQHQLDDTYYTRLYWPGVSAIVTRQIHPDGVVFLKRQGVRLEGEIPQWLIDELDERNWLATKEEMPYWGIVDWPKWHLIDAPKPKPFPKENPFVTKKREAAQAARRAAEEAARQEAEEAERQKLEAKRAANRERGRRYRANKKAEAEAAEAKRVARREQQRRYRARKKAEAEAARATPTVTSEPTDCVDPASNPSPAPIDTAPHMNLSSATSEGQVSETADTLLSPLTQVAPRQPRTHVAMPGTTRHTTDERSESGSHRLFALLTIAIILLLIVVSQIFEFLPV